MSKTNKHFISGNLYKLTKDHILLLKVEPTKGVFSYYYPTRDNIIMFLYKRNPADDVDTAVGEGVFYKFYFLYKNDIVYICSYVDEGHYSFAANTFLKKVI